MNWPETGKRFATIVVLALASGGAIQLAEKAVPAIQVYSEGICGLAFVTVLLGGYFVYGAINPKA